jgi:5-hydroxyisourate hydrolase-like protein (transthyretin family)
LFEQTVSVRAKRGKKGSRSATTEVRRTGLLTLALGKPSVLHAQLNNADGTPAANTPVCVAERLQGDDTAPLQPIARLNTGPDGSIVVPIAAGPSRDLWVVRRMDGGALASSVKVQTRPQVSARARRHSLRNGQVLKLRGIVRGDPIPAPGVLVELQARRGRGWQTFKTKRTGVDGRFTAAYRFTRTAGVQHYQLRAHVPMQASYPYAAGASNTVSVRVRG